MNPITFNNAFITAISRHPEGRRIIKIFGNWTVAPLFDYETTYDKEVELCKNGTSLEDISTKQFPFETFRMCLTERDVPRELEDVQSLRDTYRTHIVARRHNGELHLLIFWKEAPNAIRDGYDQRLINDLLLHVYTYTDSGGGRHGAASLYSARYGWHREFDSRGVTVMAGSALGSFQAFLEDAQAPTNHIVEVRPNAPGRSVEWVKARLHYTFITHEHEANRKNIVEGSRIKSDHAAELTRAAHNRKAHKRTLRAERFRFARGKTINVKATWVGVKEWQDEGGKQIYRILEPVDPPKIS
jgi:hypothetical protein